MSWSCSAVGPSDTDELLAFFDRVGSGCYCRYWHFEGDKNGWLARLAHTPEENARELAQQIADVGEDLLGIIARAPQVDMGSDAHGRIVGWMKLTRTARLQKLYDQRIYRGLPCFNGTRDNVLAIGCFLVDPELRRRGIGRALLQQGIQEAENLGASAVEAFPRRAEFLGDEERWMGPFSLFVEQGFTVVHDFAPYPVLRRAIAPRPPRP